LRNRLKQAAKAGIEVSEDVDIKTFYETLAKTYQRQGGKPPFSYEKIERYVKGLREHNAVKILGIPDECGEITAVSAVTYDKRCAYLLLHGIDADGLPKGGHDFLIFKSIESVLGFSDIFDFEGSMIPSIEAFYRKFGGVFMPYYRIWKPNMLNSVKFVGLRAYKKLRYGK
jgi:hypothetical protein